MIDRIWLNTELKTLDLFRIIRSVQDDKYVPLIIFHFPDSGKHFKSMAEGKGIRTHTLQSIGDLNTSTPERWRSRTDIILMRSDGISKHDLSGRICTSPEVAFAPLLLERYPIPGRDEIILELTAKRSDMDDLIGFVALDEAWLVEVMSGRVMDLMERMGVEEDQVLQHPMISSSLSKAQEKLGKRVRREVAQNSLEQWLEVNINSSRDA